MGAGLSGSQWVTPGLPAPGIMLLCCSLSLKEKWEAGERTQWLRSLTPCPEGSVLVPSMHKATTTNSRSSDALIWPLWVLHLCGSQSTSRQAPICGKENKNNFKKQNGTQLYLSSKFKTVHRHPFLLIGKQCKRPLLNGEGDVNLAFHQG